METIQIIEEHFKDLEVLLGEPQDKEGWIINVLGEEDINQLTEKQLERFRAYQAGRITELRNSKYGIIHRLAKEAEAESGMTKDVVVVTVSGQASLRACTAEELLQVEQTLLELLAPHRESKNNMRRKLWKIFNSMKKENPHVSAKQWFESQTVRKDGEDEGKRYKYGNIFNDPTPSWVYQKLVSIAEQKVKTSFDDTFKANTRF